MSVPVTIGLLRASTRNSTIDRIVNTT